MSTTLRKPRPGDRIEVSWLELDDRSGAQRVRGSAAHPSGVYDCSSRSGIPGARVLAEVVRRRGEHLDVRGLETIKHSEHAVPARCAHFGVCGGCGFQDTSYALQLEHKRGFVQRALQIHGLAAQAGCVQEVLGCDQPWRYRNKMDFSFSTKRWIETDEPQGAERGFALGLHPIGRFDRVLDVSDCSITFEEAGPILASARALARSLGLEAWDLERFEGLLRHLVVRKSAATGEILVDLVTSSESPERVDPFAMALVQSQPCITTLVQHSHDRPSQIAQAGPERVLFGRGFIEETLLGRKLYLSAQSFFQTNSCQAQVLGKVVREQARLPGAQLCWDLYCGAGAWALCLADCFEHIVGVDSLEAAISDAHANLSINALTNVRFECAGVEAFVFRPGAPLPDVVLVDPPRAGLAESVVQALLALAERGTKRLVYVSCNPRTAARDCALLAKGGWELVAAVPVDMFPHTQHLECVYTLVPSRSLGGMA